MKKTHFKTKLVLNSQTIRRLRPDQFQGVVGGMPVNTDFCDTQLRCTWGCRDCG